MSYLQKNKLSYNKRPPTNCGVNNDGDIICPSCNCIIVTCDDYFLVPGTGRCPRCKNSFKLTRDVAQTGNDLHYNIFNL